MWDRSLTAGRNLSLSGNNLTPASAGYPACPQGISDGGVSLSPAGNPVDPLQDTPRVPNDPSV